MKVTLRLSPPEEAAFTVSRWGRRATERTASYTGVFVSRAMDVIISGAALIVLAPLMALISGLVLLFDGRPVFFAHKRVGCGGLTFKMWKFRTMVRLAQHQGPAITAGGDRRITRLGRFLRRFKLDELPQFWNVFRGDMSIVGPRPEVPQYVDLRNTAWQRVLRTRPGITDLATLVYVHEEKVLAGQSNPEEYYRSVVLPEKLHLNVVYQEMRSLKNDARLLFFTFVYSLMPYKHDEQRVRRAFGVE